MDGLLLIAENSRNKVMDNILSEYEIPYEGFGLRKNGEEYIGVENVETTELRMGAEDFGYYTHHIPGCFFRLGVGNIEKGIISNVHTPTFNIDESAIEIGMGVMAWMGVVTPDT